MDYHSYSPEYHIKAVQLLLKNAKEFQTNFGSQLSSNRRMTEDECGDIFYTSVFVDASCSHIIASSLTAFFESLFFHEFFNLKDQYDLRAPLNNSSRWMLEEKYFWNPKKVAKTNGKLERKESFIDGVRQLFEALEIPFLIPDVNWIKITILFHYRNYISHNGFEWRKEKINEFKNLIKNLNGMGYFSKATTGEDPWVFYLTEDFGNDLLDIAFQFTQNFDIWFWKRTEEWQEKAAKGSE